MRTRCWRVLTALTIDDQKFKLATLAILAMFAIRTLSWSRKLDREREEQPGVSKRSVGVTSAELSA